MRIVCDLRPRARGPAAHRAPRAARDISSRSTRGGGDLPRLRRGQLFRGSSRPRVISVAGAPAAGACPEAGNSSPAARAVAGRLKARDGGAVGSDRSLGHVPNRVQRCQDDIAWEVSKAAGAKGCFLHLSHPARSRPLTLPSSASALLSHDSTVPHHIV